MNRIWKAVVVTAVVAVPAMGAPAAQAAPAGSFCAMDVGTGATSCFNSGPEVISFISGGRVQVPAGTKVISDRQRASIAQSPAANFVLNISWADNSYTDASYYFYASGDCDTNADVDWSIGVMPSGWNDRISSFKSYGNCATKLWENTYSGSSYGFIVNSAYVGDAMNDRASSMQFN